MVTPEMGAAGPRIPRRERWITLDEESYPGLQALVWLNPPSRLVGNLQAMSEEEQRATLSRVILAHNGWLDEDGALVPPSTDPAFWETISTELGALLVARWTDELLQLPNSRRARRQP